jgi:long-chain fatty acid transport protein
MGDLGHRRLGGLEHGGQPLRQHQRGGREHPQELERHLNHFSIGAHYKPVEDWLLQAGITYDTSPVDAKDRTADMPVDRQIRIALGAQHQLSETMTVGGAVEYVDLGSARISDPNTLTGNYGENRALFFALNANFKF